MPSSRRTALRQQQQIAAEPGRRTPPALRHQIIAIEAEKGRNAEAM
jgi:hypothetical protein